MAFFFLLMYESHNMRHTGFPRVDELSTDPREMGRHTIGWQYHFEARR